MAWAWQYQGHVEPLIQFGAAPAAPALDGWEQPIARPVPPPRRVIEGQAVAPLEPSLTQQPPPLSWWQPASSPVLPARRSPYLPPSAAPDWSTLPAASVPTLDGWGQPLAAPLRGPPTLTRLPQTFGPNPADFPAAPTVPALDGWWQPLSPPVPPSRRPYPGWLATVYEPSLTQLPPALSWWRPLSAPVLPAKRGAWLPGVLGANPADFPPVSPAPALDGWVQPLSQPVLPLPRRQSGGAAGRSLEASLGQLPPGLSWYAPLCLPTLPARRASAGWLVTTYEPTLTQPPPDPDAWILPIGQPVLSRRRNPTLPASQPPDPAVLDLLFNPDDGYWTLPVSRPVPPPARRLSGAHEEPFEPTVVRPPFEGAALSQPVLPAQRKVTGSTVSPLEPSLFLTPPALVWVAPLCQPVLPAKRSVWLPASAMPDPSITVDGVGVPDLEGWMTPTARPVLPLRRTMVGLLAAPLEPSLTVLPPGISWWMPVAQPVLQARRNAWLPVAAQPDPSTIAGVDPSPPAGWVQPIGQPVLPPRRSYTGGVYTTLEPSLTQLPPGVAWAAPLCQPVLPARRSAWLPACVPSELTNLNTVGAPPLSWWTPISQPVLAAVRRLTAGWMVEPVEPSLTQAPPPLSWWMPLAQPVLLLKRNPWLSCHVAPSADPTVIVQACAWAQPLSAPVRRPLRSPPRHTLIYLDPPVVVAPGTPRAIALLANHLGATFSLLGNATMSISTALAFFRGEDVVLNFQMTPVVDISAWVINWDMADVLGDSPAVQKVATITNGPLGQFSVTVLSADTANLPVGSYVWDARRETPGSKTTLADGSIHLKQEVTP